MLNQTNVAAFIAVAISSIDTARAQKAIDTLEPLVELTARRLALAEQVALAKWDSHTPVEDLSREAQIIKSAIKQGESAGLEPTFVANFFRAQIEANKTVQYHLLADWDREGRAPAHAPIRSATTLRLELDHLQTALIAALLATAKVRTRRECYVDVPRAVSKYLSSHNHDPRPVYAIALDRALASACTF